MILLTHFTCFFWRSKNIRLLFWFLHWIFAVFLLFKIYYRNYISRTVNGCKSLTCQIHSYKLDIYACSLIFQKCSFVEEQDSMPTGVCMFFMHIQISLYKSLGGYICITSTISWPKLIGSGWAPDLKKLIQLKVKGIICFFVKNFK